MGKKFLQGRVTEKKSCKEEVKRKNSCRVNHIVRLTNCAPTEGQLGSHFILQF